MGRRFGQHFLARKSILERIASAACVDGDPVVIEIGPGKGSLTECLLAQASKVIAIEVDPVLVHYLRQKFRDALSSEHLVLIEGDILKTDLAAFRSGCDCWKLAVLHHLADPGQGVRSGRPLESRRVPDAGRGGRAFNRSPGYS